MQLAITGTVNPDCTIANTGDPAGIIGGESYWSWTAGGRTWWLQWLGSEWLICADWNADGIINADDMLTGAHWLSPNLLGEYTPANGATGTATVAEYVESPTGDTLIIRWNVSGEITILRNRE